MRYYYEVDKNGFPIEGSNIRTIRQPRSASKRWVEYTSQQVECCTYDPEGTVVPIVRTGQSRYYVRLDENKKPVSGSLRRKKISIPSFNWQEIFPPNCCN